MPLRHLDAPTPVAAAIIEHDGNVLLVRPHYAADFALIAGYLEPLESIEAAVVRGAKEETGLDIQIEPSSGPIRANRWAETWHWSSALRG